jgi:hypothetical protein
MPEWYEKQIGPLPLGIWVGVVAVGAGASYLINRKSKATAAATPAPGAADTGALTDATSGAFGSLPAGVNLGGIVALPGGIPAGQTPNTPQSTTPTPITDNNQWLREATDQLIAKGYDPGLVDSALRSYLNGYPPTAQQQAIVNLALELLGAPPFPVLTLPTPTPTPATDVGTPATASPNYGPVWPQQGPGQAPAGMICPPQAPQLVQGPTGYTCATAAQFAALKAYLGL